MKLRQKLAVVLATAMVVTAVPVITMAEVPKMSKEVFGVKDVTYLDGQYVRFKAGGDLFDEEEFWGTLTNAKYTGALLTTQQVVQVRDAQGNVLGDVVATWTKDTEVRFKVNGYIPEDTQMWFYLDDVLLKGGDAYFTVDPNNTGIIGTSGAETKNEVKVYLGTTKDQKGIVTVGDAPNIYLEGQLADVIITEPYEGAIVAGAGSDGLLKVELTINNSDYEFNSRFDQGKVSFEKGFYGKTATGVTWSIEKYGDKATIYIPVSQLQNLNSGKIVISGLPVMANTKTPADGDLKVSIGGEVTGLDNAVVAKIVSADTKLTMKDDKVVNMIAGRDKEVEFKHAENVKDGILANHTITYSVENGFLGYYNGDTKRKDATKAEKIESFIDVNGYAIPDGVQVVDVTMDGDKFTGFTVKAYDDNVYYVDNKGYTKEGKLTYTDKEDFTYKMHVYTELGTANGTEVKIIASGERAIDEDVTVVAAKVAAPITYTGDVMPLKVGLQNQEYAGKVTITETDKGMIQRGEIILKTDADGYEFAAKGAVKVTSGDLVLDTPQYDKTDGTLIIPVKYTSKTASTIEITGFKVTVDRTVPEGTYDLKIDGTALGTDGNIDAYGDVALSKFFQITTPNTEDIKNSALKAVDVKFVVGSKEYTVDGVAKTMDAAAYLQNGRTMVPLRYVSEAFGIATENVLFSNGVVTIIAGEKVLQFTLGSNVMYVNGSPITMDAKAELKDGRAYIPMKFVGAALGVTASWDSASQTASFSNKK